MPMAYVTTPGAVVRKKQRRLVITKDQHTLAEWRLVHLDGVVLVGRSTLTSAAMLALLGAGVPTSLVSRGGEYRGQLTPVLGSGVHARMAQVRLYDNVQLRQRCATRIVHQKLTAMKRVIEAHATNHATAILAQSHSTIHQLCGDIDTCQTPGSLRGIEGAAARTYWAAFRTMNRTDLPFGGRSRRPPKDEINALLSFGYTLLASELTWVIQSSGLDPLIGYFHEMRARRPALALDMMEPFRHIIVDRLVLQSINRKQLQPFDFAPPTKRDGYRMTAEGLMKYVALYEQVMEQEAPKWAIDPIESSTTPQNTTNRDLLRTAVAHVLRKMQRIERHSIEVAA